VEIKDEMSAIGNEESASAIQSCAVTAKEGIRRDLKEPEGTELTFFQQTLKLLEERWEMHDDAMANDARDRSVDQSYSRGRGWVWPRE